MMCKDCSLELTDLNAYKQHGKFRGWCKDCWRERFSKPATKRWKKRNPDWVKASKLNHHHRRMFGGLREIVLERDDHRCVQCGLTNEESKFKWGYSLTVDHIDGRGKPVPPEKKNNNPENPQTLCCSCHGKKTIIQIGKQKVLGL